MLASMQIALGADVAAMIRRVIGERQLTFDQVVNETLHTALRPGPAQSPFRTPTFSMRARVGVDLGKLLRLAGDLEDEAVLARLRGETGGSHVTRRTGGG